MPGQQADRRADLRAADDTQSLETRRRLVEAFRAAAAEELPRPSVTWICDRSGVARSTFYTHFATVDDLAVFTITGGFADLSAVDVALRSAHAQDRRAITRAGLEPLVDGLERARPDLAYAMRIGSRAAVLERLVAQVAHHTRHTIDTEYPDRTEEERALTTEFVSAATVHTVLRWLDGGTLPRERLVEHLIDLLPTELTR